ncbi:hypothetical protein [Laceyella tengchongensis]|jgi:hypothetical protein
MMKNRLSLMATTLALTLSIFSFTPITSAEENNLDPNIFKDGQLAKALDSKEINKVMENGLQVEGKLGDDSSNAYTFDDGSTLEMKTELEDKGEVVSKDSGGEVVNVTRGERSVTGKTTYTAKSWTGMKLWTYTLYLDARVNGSRVTWFEGVPSSSHSSGSMLNWWRLDSEALGVTYSADKKTAIATTSAKFSYGIRDVVNVQTLSLKGTLYVYGNGTYKGVWKRLN